VSYRPCDLRLAGVANDTTGVHTGWDPQRLRPRSRSFGFGRIRSDRRRAPARPPDNKIPCSHNPHQAAFPHE